MPRHPKDPFITKKMLTLNADEVEQMTPVEFRDLVVPFMNAINTKPFPKRGGPFGVLGRWQKKYTRKRIYEVLVVLYNSHVRTGHFVAYVTSVLNEHYAESVQYEDLDLTRESRYDR